jgi:hypothetical protein
MAKKRTRGNGDADVYPRRNREGKVIGYRGAYCGSPTRRREAAGGATLAASRKRRRGASWRRRGALEKRPPHWPSTLKSKALPSTCGAGLRTVQRDV